MRNVLLNAGAELFEVEVEDGGDEEGQGLWEDEAADDHKSKAAVELGAFSDADRKGEGAHDGCKGGHHNGTESHQASFVDGFFWRKPFLLHFKGIVDDHDPVLFNDPNEEKEADGAEKGKGLVEKEEGDDASKAGKGDGGEDRQGMDEAFVEDPEDKIHGKAGSD